MTLFDTGTPAVDVDPRASITGQGPAGLRGEAEKPPAGPAHPLHVVGVDLSLTRSGIATRDSVVCVTSGGKRDDTLAQRQQRLRHLRQRILTTISGAAGDIDPDLIVIEGPSYASQNAGSQHDRSGLWWLLIDAFTIRGWRVIEVSPSTRMKYATGKGNAGKDVVLAAAVRRLPHDITNNDEADAAWLCALGHDLLGQPIVQVPETHRTALAALRTQIEGTTRA